MRTYPSFLVSSSTRLPSRPETLSQPMAQRTRTPPRPSCRHNKSAVVARRLRAGSSQQAPSSRKNKHLPRAPRRPPQRRPPSRARPVCEGGDALEAKCHFVALAITGSPRWPAARCAQTTAADAGLLALDVEALLDGRLHQHLVHGYGLFIRGRCVRHLRSASARGHGAR